MVLKDHLISTLLGLSASCKQMGQALSCLFLLPALDKSRWGPTEGLPSHLAGVVSGGKGVWPSLQSAAVILGSLYVASHFTLERHRTRVRTLFSEKDQILYILSLQSHTVFVKDYFVAWQQS